MARRCCGSCSHSFALTPALPSPCTCNPSRSALTKYGHINNPRGHHPTINASVSFSSATPSCALWQNNRPALNASQRRMFLVQLCKFMPSGALSFSQRGRAVISETLKGNLYREGATRANRIHLIASHSSFFECEVFVKSFECFENGTRNHNRPGNDVVYSLRNFHVEGKTSMSETKTV